MKNFLLLPALFFCVYFSNAQATGNQNPNLKMQESQRIKIVKKPVSGEDKIKAKLAAMESQMQSVQATIQKAQADLDNLKSIQNDLKGQLDSMNEMSEETSMRLQMAMDRRSKFVEALSNIMKKINDTQNTIVQNLK
jgi:chromosome segregation ATPase